MTERDDKQAGNPIIIVGAGRQGRNVCEILNEAYGRDRVVGYLDDTRQRGEEVQGHPVLNGFAAVRDSEFVRRYDWIVALGDNVNRYSLYRTLADEGACFVSAIHPTAQISPYATLGACLFVGQFVRVAPGTRIGDCATIEAFVNLGVDAEVGDAAFVGPGAQLLGGATLGNHSFLGAAAIVSNNVKVGRHCTVGANSLVLRSLPDGTSAHGTPARPALVNQRPLSRCVED